jgi:hypothetical protein
MPLVGFEPTISAGERRQTYSLDRHSFSNILILYSHLRYVEGTNLGLYSLDGSAGWRVWRIRRSVLTFC